MLDLEPELAPLAGKLRHLKLEITDNAVAIATIDRPPVNAFSYEVYEDFHTLMDILEHSDRPRALVITSRPEARAWSAGADLNNFLDQDARRRMAEAGDWRARFYRLGLPTIAALNNPAVGVGFTTATLCDMRVASQDAFFSVPEIDRGLATGGAKFFRMNISQGLIREMVLTGRRFTGEELRHSGLFQYVLPKDQVVPKAIELAELIAKKSPAAIRATKANLNACELVLDWEEAAKLTKATEVQLTGASDAREGISAFLQKREAAYRTK